MCLHKVTNLVAAQSVFFFFFFVSIDLRQVVKERVYLSRQTEHVLGTLLVRNTEVQQEDAATKPGPALDGQVLLNLKKRRTLRYLPRTMY